MEKTLTIVIVDTDAPVLARSALDRTVAALKGAAVVVFSDACEQWKGYPTVEIPALRGVDDYNRAILDLPPEYVKTDFFLVIQYDGFVINPPEFSPHFFHYDYIGAPWTQFEHFVVGNGGFSWRSRRLAEAAKKLSGYRGAEAEDLFICRTCRVALETNYGCRFCPRSLATHFSAEMQTPPFPTFGFHGVFHLPKVYSNDLDFLVDNLPSRVAADPAMTIFPCLRSVSPAAEQALLRRREALLAAT